MEKIRIMQEKASSPVLNTKALQVVNSTNLGGIMTLNGVIGKSLLLILLTVASAVFSWFYMPESILLNIRAYLIGAALVGFGLAMFISFKPSVAPFASPVYAVVEGLFLGMITLIFESMYPGIAFQAIVGTMAVFFAMLALYRFKIVRVTERFKSIIFGATAGIALVYVVSIVLSFFGISIPMIHEGGIVGIGFSLFVIGIAAMNLAIDFDFIEEQVERGASKNMEWFAAFGLLVTLVWLYLEILRLLGKIRN